MARPKSFDKATVLRSAMFLFWKQGYANTSMRDLEQATHLTPSSIYNEFGSKLRLFEQALEFYINWIIKGRLNRYLVNEGEPLDNLRKFLVTAINDVPDNVKGDACFLMNTNVDIEQIHPSIKTIVDKGYRIIEQALQQFLKLAQDKGRIDSSYDINVLSQHVIILLSGILVSSKNDMPVETLEQVIDFTLKTYQ